MKRDILEEALSNLNPRRIQEAAESPPGKPFRISRAWGIAAALLITVFSVQIVWSSPLPAVTAYAQGSNEEITSAGAVMQTGTIRDDGSQTGHPLMFYLAGQDIEQVRFSCKNQKIRFEDWTETRDGFGSAQNFTVPYGADPSEYYYLLIDWVPDQTVEALHRPGTSIADLPPALREDLIVMEIQFSNGKTAVKAITVSLLDDGTFFAAFSDYKLGPEDDFVSRPDAQSIPREILYGPDGEYPFGDAPVIEGTYQDADPEEPEKLVEFDEIRFFGTIADVDAENNRILVRVEEEFLEKYALNDVIAFDLTPDRLEWLERTGERVEIVCTDLFFLTMPPIGDLISIVIAPEV